MLSTAVKNRPFSIRDMFFINGQASCWCCAALTSIRDLAGGLPKCIYCGTFWDSVQSVIKLSPLRLSLHEQFQLRWDRNREALGRWSPSHNHFFMFCYFLYLSTGATEYIWILRTSSSDQDSRFSSNHHLRSKIKEGWRNGLCQSRSRDVYNWVWKGDLPQLEPRPTQDR